MLADGCKRFDSGDFAGARLAFETARSADPDSVEIISRLAAACASLRDWPAAETAWRDVLNKVPQLAVARTGLAIALHEQGRSDEAFAEFNRLVQDQPNLAAAHFNLGDFLLDTGRPKEAVAAFRNAVALDPEAGEHKFNLSLALLKSGAFKPGALAYEARWKAQLRGKERPFGAAQRWSGRALPRGAKLLLWGEQGIGDEVMFSGLVRAAIEAAQGTVLLECAPRLVSVFQRAFPSANVYPRSDPPVQETAAADWQCALGTLPGLLWPSGTPTPPAPWLRPKPESVERMQQTVAKLGHGRKIGIAWRGGLATDQRPRLIPPSLFEPLLRRADVVPICLQHGPVEDYLTATKAVAGKAPICIPGVDPLTDLEGFAALLACMDGVVSVDNSTVHLAGALGIPTLVLLTRDNDWRWGVDGVPCPWYQSVMRVWQQAEGNWSVPQNAAERFVEQILAP